MITEPEWENEYDAVQKLCPCCREGTLILRCNDINGKPVYGCSNYPYCEYTCDELPKKSLWRKTFEKEDEFRQWLQKKGLESTTINTYVTAASQYEAFLQEDKTGKAWQKTAVISRKPSEVAVKNKNDPYPNLKIGQIARFKLIPLLASGRVDAAEIQKLTDSRYCKHKFDLDYPLLSKSCRYDSLGYSRYYSDHICIDGEYFYVCSQWFETPANNDRPYLLRWMREHSVPESAVKNKNDPYPHLTIEEIVRIKLLPLLKSGRVVAAEIQKLTDGQYCKQKFDLDYPLLSKKRYDDLGYSRYYSDRICIDGEYFYVCSKWSETHVNNNRPYLLRWMREYSVPETVQSSPSSDTSVIAAPAESTSPETAEKNTHDLYPHLTIGQIVISKLWPLLESGQVDAAEIQKLTDSQYCKQKFDLDYPLLSKSCRYNNLGTSLYYEKRICINGEYFYVCYQWYNNSRPLLLRWLQEYSVPESVQSSPSSDIDIIATPAESTGPETVSVSVSSKGAARTESTSPKTVFVNVNSRVAAPAEKTNPEPVQAEQHDDSRTADSLFLEDAMKRIKECIARNGDVLSVKCERGYTPLMVAAQCDDADVLAVLIAKMKEANGNFERRNDEGKTAYIVARESRAEKAMSLLKEAGARTDAAIIIARRKISAAEQNNCEKT